MLLMLLPPQVEGEGARLPRETIFVIDTSGSMHGTSIQQARSALLLALARLQPEDTFNVIQFNSRTWKLFDQPVAADRPAIELARAYVERLGANGGTEMLSALTAAFSQRGELESNRVYVERLGANGGTEMLSALTAAFSQRGELESNRVRQVIFITDGSVGNEAQLFAYIHENLGERRLFTVGIGSAPNSHFMTRAAKFGRGTFTYVGTAGEVSEKMGELFRKLESPVLSHIELDFEDDRVEVWPQRIPDLYLGEPVVVTARLPDVPSGLDVRGRRGEQPWGIGFQLRGGKTHSGVAKLWARRKIAALMDSMDSMTEGADRDEVRAQVVAQVIDVALQHHLVSKFTSLIAVDVTPTAPHGSPMAKGMTKAVPTQLPAGWSHQHTVGTLPKEVRRPSCSLF